MTRHDLKDQLQHDQFTDAVTGAVSYASTNRKQVIRWVIIGAVVLTVAGGIWAFLNYQKTQRQNELAEAMSVLDAQVGPASELSKTYATEDAKNQAATKSLSDFVAKYGSSNEGMTALFYLTSLKAKTDQNAAEAGFKRVAESGSDVSPLAKIALANFYIGQNKTAAAQDLLRSIINNPTSLVSKAQAQILLAQTEATANPQDAKGVLKMVDAEDAKRPAVADATKSVSAQLK